MAIDFPSAGLVVGQLFTAPSNGVTYRWDGTLWLTQTASGGGTGDFMASGVPTLGGGAVVLNLATIVTGNSGNWYSAGQYKPPAGRYYISCGCSASLSGAGDFSMDIGIRKNFVQTASRTYNNRTTAFSFGGVVTDGVFNANGTTDQFDFVVTTNVAASTVNSAWICAFPLTGMQGPPGVPATGYLLSNATATITAGYTYTPFNIGTVSSGTTTLAGANGNYQYMTNNGASTLAAPAADTAISLLVTNGASAGAITFSGFTVGAATGDALTTTNTSKFLINVVRINATSTYLIKALQ